MELNCKDARPTTWFLLLQLEEAICLNLEIFGDSRNCWRYMMASQLLQVRSQTQLLSLHLLVWRKLTLQLHTERHGCNMRQSKLLLAALIRWYAHVCAGQRHRSDSEHKNAQEYTRDYKSAVSRMEMNGAKMSPGEQFLSSGVQSAREKFWRRVD